MDGEAEELGEAAAGAGFEPLGEVVDAADGQLPGQGGVAGGDDLALDFMDLHLVDVEQLGEFPGGAAQVVGEGAGQLVQLGGGG